MDNQSLALTFYDLDVAGQPKDHLLYMCLLILSFVLLGVAYKLKWIHLNWLIKDDVSLIIMRIYLFTNLLNLLNSKIVICVFENKIKIIEKLIREKISDISYN